MELQRRRIVLFSCFALFSGLTKAQNVIQSNQRQQVAISNDAYSSNQASPAPKLMNTLLTVAAANGVLPDVLPALRPDQRQNYNVIPTNTVNNGPTFASSPTILTQQSQNFQNGPVFRLNSNQANGARINLPQAQINVNQQQQGPVAKLNPLVIDKNFGIPMNLEVTLPQVSLGVEVPDVALPPPPPPPPPPAPVQPIPTPTFVPISTGPIGDVGGRSRYKSWLPIIFLSLLNNGRCGNCGGNGGGCGGGCGGGGCSSCNTVPVPYPIPIPVISPIVVRCDSSSEEDSSEADS